MASQSVKRGLGALAIVGAGVLGYFLNGCEGFKTEKKKEEPTIIYNGDVTNNYCCDKDTIKVDKIKPGKGKGKDKPRKDLEEVIGETPAADEPCFDYKPIQVPCLTDQEIVYEFKGKQYTYISPGAEAEFPKVKRNGKIAKNRTETVKTYDFISTDGLSFRNVPETKLSSWDRMYKIVPCDQTTASKMPEKDININIFVVKEERNNQPIYNAAPGYDNISSFNLAIAGRNGAFVFNSMSANVPMPMMGNRVIGYNPTVYILPNNSLRQGYIEPYGEKYEDPNGNTNARITTKHPLQGIITWNQFQNR
ncbi:MAG TPA: hypothetical protein VEC16_00135 [Alphaproteobacteria bacterium]|nr:hypothetical protein [Alphaproteobacteria bacterium]